MWEGRRNVPLPQSRYQWLAEPRRILWPRERISDIIDDDDEGDGSGRQI